MLGVLFLTVLAENILLTRGLGADAASPAGIKKRAAGFSAAVTYMCTVSAFFVWIVEKFFGRAADYKLWQPAFFICILCMLYFVSTVLAWRFAGKKAAAVRKYLHFAVFNSAVMGTMLLSTVSCRTVWEYLLYGFGSGAGFSLAFFMTSAMSEKLSSDKVPAAFRGFPLTMIYLGILGMAFFGITGTPAGY